MNIEFHRKNGMRRELWVENVWCLSSDRLKELCLLVMGPKIPYAEYQEKIEAWYQRTIKA